MSVWFLIITEFLVCSCEDLEECVYVPYLFDGSVLSLFAVTYNTGFPLIGMTDTITSLSESPRLT